MNNQTDKQELDDILDALIASGIEPDSPELEEWIRGYPAYEKELTDFAVSWSLMESLPSASEAEPADVQALVRRGMDIVHGLLQQDEASAGAPATIPFTSLINEGKKQHLTLQQLAQTTDLGQALLRKLDLRRIQYASIPRAAIERLASAIHQEFQTVALYLQQDPVFASAAQHRAEQAPQLGEPEDFIAAVKADPTMNPDQRARWVEIAEQREQ
jgi:hypothetical protein